MLEDEGIVRVPIVVSDRKPIEEPLLAPLKPPTDPAITRADEERKRNAARRKQMLLKGREDEEPDVSVKVEGQQAIDEEPDTEMGEPADLSDATKPS
jgi:hypothetical protein